MKSLSRFLKSNGWLILILIAALALRLTRLYHQSLWLDELHLMIEADPSVRWKEMVGWLQCCDTQPPLYHTIQHLLFAVFGYNEHVARLTSAYIGVLSVWAMYYLGKEVGGKSLGLICAALCCFNFFNIFYSQEARPYILCFLFVVLSFTCFIRFLKIINIRTVLWYALSTLLLLYTHYFSFFVVAVQVALALLFLFQEPRQERKRYIGLFSLALAILVIGYLPWLHIFLHLAPTQIGWIPPTSPDFMEALFFEYFGNAESLKPLLLLLLATFFVKVASDSRRYGPGTLRNSPVLLCFVVLFFWIFLGNLIPYVKSLISAPIVYPRYMIIIAPAYILLIAYGIEVFRYPAIKHIILWGFLLLSLVHLVLVKRYYTAIIKTQFREMTEYVVHVNRDRLPIINELTGWHQQYYLKKNGSKADVLTGSPKEAIVDSILQRTSPRYDVKGFWIVGAHGDKKLDSAVLLRVEAQYELVSQKDFFDAWAQQFLRRQ